MFKEKADVLSRLQLTKFKSSVHGTRTNASSPSSPTRELASITQRLLAASLNNASTAAYRRSWKLFTDWAQSHLGGIRLALPLQPAFIALFVSHLYSRNYASSTVISYISAIGYVHKLAGVDDPPESAIIR